MNCIICGLPLIEQPLKYGLPLDKADKKQYKKDLKRANSIQECEKCKTLIKIKKSTNSNFICMKCGGEYKSLSKKASQIYHKWNVSRPYYSIVLSCPTHGVL